MPNYISGGFGGSIDTSEITDGAVTFDKLATDAINAISTPIGAIIAFHKSFANTPTLPSGWVECNGQVLSDAESVYNGQTIPDLNSAVEETYGRFLRGGSTSGATEGSQNKAHTHTIPFYNTGSVGQVVPHGADQNANDSSTSGSSGGSEARPVSFVVVWIMRVK